LISPVVVRRSVLGRDPGRLVILDQAADLVTFSAPNGAGGPQAGLCVGREDLIKKLRAQIRGAALLRLIACQTRPRSRETLVAYVTGRAPLEVPTYSHAGAFGG